MAEAATRRAEAWAPAFGVAAAALVAARVAAAAVAGVADCDETFNYWEPAHFLLFGEGFQTWEYAPAFALRSYGYVGAHALLLACLRCLAGGGGGVSRLLLFRGLRAALACLAGLSDAALYCGARAALGPRVARLLLLLLLACAGCAASAPAFLPASAAAALLALGHACWLAGRLRAATWAAAAACLLGWPFAALAALPLALDVLARAPRASWAWAASAAAACLLPQLAADLLCYGRPVAPLLRLLAYNLTARDGAGSQLYGSEEWTFYAANLFLNFSLALPLALAALPLALCLRRFGSARLRGLPRLRLAAFLAPSYLWIAFMLYLPHKEERFMFVIYPLLCLLAALSLELLRSAALAALAALLARSPTLLRMAKLVVAALLVAFFVLFFAFSAARVVALHRNYSASMDVYTHLGEVEIPQHRHLLPQDVAVCVGKEWYRFPSSFFLPPGVHLHFLRSGFDGQLPKQYQAGNGTWAEVDGFNDRNLEEPDRYVEEKTCHYIVDLLLEDQTEEPFSEEEWEVVFEKPFLDAARSPNRFLRAFYVPGLSDAANVFAPYQLLRRRSLLPPAA